MILSTHTLRVNSVSAIEIWFLGGGVCGIDPSGLKTMSMNELPLYQVREHTVLIM